MTLQRTKIMRAAKSGDMRSMEKMIDKILKPLNAKDIKGNTALINAIIEGQEEMAQKLVATGVDLDIRNRKGQTALMLAIQSNMERLVSDLVDADADLDLTDKEGMTAFYYAAASSNKNISQVIAGDFCVKQMNAYETGDVIYAQENENIVSMTTITLGGERLRSLFDFNAKLVSYDVESNNNKGILVETFENVRNKQQVQQAAKFLERQHQRQYGAHQK